MPSKISPDFPPTASFKSFSWLRERCQTLVTDTLSLAKNIVAGVKHSLELIERSEMDAEAADKDSRPFLNAAHVNILQRFAIASYNTFGGVFKRRFDFLKVQSITKERK